MPSATSHQQSQDPPHNLDLQVEATYSSPFELQPPPSKSKHCVNDINQMKSLNSCGYHSYTTSLPQLVDMPMTTKQYHLERNLKEQGAAQDEVMLTSSNTSSFSSNAFTDMLTDDYEDSPDESKPPIANSVNDVVLSFSSSLISDMTLNDVDHAASSHIMKTQLSEESLPELNLTINPHHFDPL